MGLASAGLKENPMDHRWDDLLRDEHRRRIEEGRYARPRVETDEEVERRDRIALQQRAGNHNRSPWEIGAAHYDQRDLYTRNARVDDLGYGLGPRSHPDIGSYAYPRPSEPPPPSMAGRPAEGSAASGPSLHERQAWPWLNYERVQRGPKGWRRADDAILEDACEALAYDAQLDAREIQVSVKDAEVTLTGRVPDRRAKRLAEALVEHVRGIEDVHNRLRIEPLDTTGGGAGGNDGDELVFEAPIPVIG